MAWKEWDDFDKRMCGKWASEEFDAGGVKIRIFVEIFQCENQVTVKFNYDDPFCDQEAFYVEYSDSALYFFHNDRLHRAEFVLQLEADSIIKCEFSMANCLCEGIFSKNLVFIPYDSLSATERKSQKIEILREHSEYGNKELDLKFDFSFNERENLLDVIQKYNLDELVKDKTDAELSISLMNWLCKYYKHGNPPNGLNKERTPQALMEAADKFNKKTNCRGLSLILSQLIRAYGVKAFHVTCSPYEDPFLDCHVVVCVYCESMNKFIMLDPTYNLYLKNKDGDIIGLEEFREILISGDELLSNEENLASLKSYRNYMAKNLIRIERYTENSYGIDGKRSTSVILIPQKYLETQAQNFDEETQKHFITSTKCFWQI